MDATRFDAVVTKWSVSPDVTFPNVYELRLNALISAPAGDVEIAGTVIVSSAKPLGGFSPGKRVRVIMTSDLEVE